MIKLLNRAGLDALNRLFRFEGGQLPQTAMDSGPVQRVYDVSRMVERQIETDPRVGGFFQLAEDHVHTGAGSKESDDSPYDLLQDSWGIQGQRWLWLMQSWVSGTVVASFTSAVLTLQTASVGGALPTLGTVIGVRELGIGLWVDKIQQHDPSGSGYVATMVSHNQPTRPVFFPEGSQLGYRSTVTGAMTVRFVNLFWVGPTGVFPPGA